MTEPKVYCKHDKMVRVKDLKPNPDNPNKHPPQQILMLAHVIEGNGWRCPITVSKLSGLIVRGHARLEAGKHLELDRVPVQYQPYASKEEEFSDLIADNKIAELSDLNPEDVAAILRGMGADSRSLTAYAEHEITLLLDGSFKDGTAAPGDGAAPTSKLPANIRATKEQDKTIRRAIDKMKGTLPKEEEHTDGKCLSLIAAKFTLSNSTDS